MSSALVAADNRHFADSQGLRFRKTVIGHRFPMLAGLFDRHPVGIGNHPLGLQPSQPAHAVGVPMIRYEHRHAGMERIGEETDQPFGLVVVRGRIQQQCLALRNDHRSVARHARKTVQIGDRRMYPYVRGYLCEDDIVRDLQAGLRRNGHGGEKKHGEKKKTFH